ncbi:hypothetical protein BJ878DRAFT_510510 [Calycina marina]|uniref:DM2 domain-containing protein n=1 Tax=Calycina marina TaxID=1763456 RepID=A0A9P7Z166_9HELO|nr:hypothetical protein BJ878DRAFT_510510 [Calycina marina]
MQPLYRPQYAQQASTRSPHATATPSRRGIGPITGHPQNQLSQAQSQAQQAAQEAANNRAKLRSRKPTDRVIPDGIEECIIGDGVTNYRQLRELERKLDATMMRKRLDIHDAVNRNVKRYRTLRLWISNTVEDQPWQADNIEPDAFDFNNDLNSSFNVKIEGRLLDEEADSMDSDDSDSEDEADADAMDEGKDKKSKPAGKEYRLSHFFKQMTVDFERRKARELDPPVNWTKPAVTGNNSSLPISADFDQLEFKRLGDDNVNITINLHRDETPERFMLSPALADILDTNESTRAEAVMGIWNYIKAMGLQEDDDKRTFELDDRLKLVFMNGRGDKGYIPSILEDIVPHIGALPPIKLPYTIRVDKAFHDNPTPTIYDIRVITNDPLNAALNAYINNPSYGASLREVTELNDNLAKVVQKISNSKSKHAFFEALANNPTEFFPKWLSSQKRDLEIISGEANRGGGEDARVEEWRCGGKDGVWGSENARQSVTLIVGTAPKK